MDIFLAFFATLGQEERPVGKAIVGFSITLYQPSYSLISMLKCLYLSHFPIDWGQNLHTISLGQAHGNDFGLMAAILDFF